MMLDKKSIQILEYIRDNSPANSKDIDSLVSDMSITRKHIHTLQSHNLIIGCTMKSVSTNDGIKYFYLSPYEITPDGLGYLESVKIQMKKEKWENIHKWTNTIISALALLSAVPALILSIIQLLK